MLKIAILIWIMLGVVLAGVLVTAVVATPSLYNAHGMTLIPIAGAVGYLLAIPFAYLIGRKIAAVSARR